MSPCIFLIWKIKTYVWNARIFFFILLNMFFPNPKAIVKFWNLVYIKHVTFGIVFFSLLKNVYRGHSIECWLLHKEFISRVRSMSEKPCLTSKIHSLLNVKIMNFLFITFSFVFQIWGTTCNSWRVVTIACYFLTLWNITIKIFSQCEYLFFSMDIT